MIFQTPLSEILNQRLYTQEKILMMINLSTPCFYSNIEPIFRSLQKDLELNYKTTPNRTWASFTPRVMLQMTHKYHNQRELILLLMIEYTLNKM